MHDAAVIPDSKQTPIVVFGSRVRDVTVDIDLSAMHLVRPDLRDLIRFEDNDPVLRVGTQVATLVGNRTFNFTLNLQATQKRGRREPAVRKDPKPMYVLHPGTKYDFRRPVGERPGHPQLVLPARGLSWGGGGINLAVTLRGLSSRMTSPLVYVDTARPYHEREEWQKFWRAARSLTTEPKLASALPKPSNSRRAAPPPTDAIATARRWMDAVLRHEAGFRHLAQLLSAFDQQDSLELFLAARQIDFALYRHAPASAPLNLVFGSLRDASREFTDKIIFRGWRPLLGDDHEDAILAHLDGEIRTPGLIVINTVYDPPLFRAALRWAKRVQDRQQALPDRLLCPVVACLTERNLKHLSGRRRAALGELKTLRNLYVIFNDAEFGQFSAAPRRRSANASLLLKTIEQRLRPTGEDLRTLLDDFISDFPKADQHVIVTLGEVGSMGVANDVIRCTGSYVVPQKRVFSTSGCGDAFAAGVALLAYHWHNGSSDVSAAWGAPQQRLDLMLKVGAAAAYARATSPTSSVSSRDVLALLQNAYLPFAERGLVTQPAGPGPLAPPATAELVGLRGLERILDG